MKIMALVCTSVVLMIFLSPSGAVAFNPVHTDRLKKTNMCSKCDLSRADLSGTGFSGATWMDGSKCNAGSIGECKK